MLKVLRRSYKEIVNMLLDFRGRVILVIKSQKT